MLEVMTGASPVVASPERAQSPCLGADEAVARARSLAPGFRARAAETEALRQLPRTTIQELFDSGLFDIALPRRWGGPELGPDVWVDVIAEIAAACGSTGWVYGVLLGHVWLVSHFSLEAQREVFETPNTLIASLI